MGIVRTCTFEVQKEGPRQGLFSDFQWLAFARPMKGTLQELPRRQHSVGQAMKTICDFPQKNKGLDMALKIINPTSGIVSFKKVLSDQGGSTVLNGTQRYSAKHNGRFPWGHDRALRVLRLNETCRYYATRSEGIADKEKPRCLQHRGLFGKDACNVFCIPARSVHNPEGRSV